MKILPVRTEFFHPDRHDEVNSRSSQSSRHVSTSSKSSSGPNLRIQVLHKLTRKMQVGIPVAYSVCEVKLDKINHWICVQREDLSVAMVY